MLSSIKSLKWIIPGLIFSVLVISCSSDDEPDNVPVDEQVLIDYELTGTWGASDLQSFIKFSGLNLPVDERLKYDVQVYDVTYNTLYKGQTITASCKIFVPQDVKGKVSTVCFSHGTIGSDAEAFTNLASNNSVLVLLSGLAGMGNVVVAPDLIGFGASATYYHPYYIQEPTATATIDAIYASKLVADDLDAKCNGKLYLAGYSQGGYSTMVTHKWIEEKGINYFELKASFPASGGYDITGVQDFFFEQEVYEQPFFLAYVANAYKDYYEWTNLSLSDVFNEPYASKIPDLFDGSYTGTQINDALNDTISVLVNADYLENSESTKYDDIVQSYVANSPTNWIPEKPMYMYHGSADVTVPYQNSVDVYNQFIDMGASNVTFLTILNGTHSTGVGPYIVDFVSTLISLEND